MLRQRNSVEEYLREKRWKNKDKPPNKKIKTKSYSEVMPCRPQVAWDKTK